jgi:tripartite-type tricarboxylate transporter receptor subunit TctC
MNHSRITRRAFAASAASAAFAMAAPLSALAQDARPIEWVVGYPAGGGSDAVARAVAEQMGKALGTSIIINNKPGAATNIAAEYVARSRTPGQMLFTADFATLAANPALFAKLPYDPDKDFVPLGLLARFPLILVTGPAVPATNFKDFVAWVKASKDPVNYASSGIGSPQHLAGELFAEKSGLKLQHVPYRGGAPAVQDLIGWQVPFALMDSATVMQYVQAGKLRALGVASASRVKVLPNIPTLAEQGLPGVEAFAWQGVVVPAGTPPAQVDAFAKALRSALESEPVKARYQALAIEALPGSPQQMSDFVKAERARWGALIKAANIKLD